MEHGIDKLWNNFLDSPTYIFGSSWNVSSKFIHLYSFVVYVGFSMTSPNIVLETQ